MKLVIWDHRNDLNYINNPPEIDVEIGAITVHITIDFHGEVTAELYRNPYNGGDPVSSCFAKQRD